MSESLYYVRISQYELEIQETKAIIDKGRVQNRSVWAEKHQALLEHYESVLEVLKTVKCILKLGKRVVNIQGRNLLMDSITAINGNTDGLKSFCSEEKRIYTAKGERDHSKVYKR